MALIGLASLCIIGTLLIVVLFRQRKRRGRTEEALHASEQRYLMALAGSTDGLWDWDIRSNTVFYSDRFSRSSDIRPRSSPAPSIHFAAACTPRTPTWSGPPFNAIFKIAFHSR